MEDTNKRFNVDTRKYTIEKIIKRIEGEKTQDNKLIIPEYQRDYVWNTNSDVPKLLSSLYKGFPVGFIIIWDNSKHEEHQLIDGLQRHYSIYQISKKPFNFLHYDMFVYWMSQVEKKDYKKNKFDQENFRHFRSYLNHKKTNYTKREKEDLFHWIKTTTKLTDEYRGLYRNFVDHYEKWFNEEFKEINIPHTILKEFGIDEVSDIFEITNSTGKKLTKFEIYSAEWSKHKIRLDEKVDFIDDFHFKREREYKDKLLLSSNENGLVKFNYKEIIPSNFIYALFSEIIKNKSNLKYSFFDKNNKLQDKAMEAITEIIKEALISIPEYKLNEIEFHDIGEKLSEKITSKEDVVNLKNKIEKAFKVLIGNVNFLEFAKTNGQGKNLTFPSWLIAAFVIHIIKDQNSSRKTKNFTSWFIYEMLFENRFSSSTGNTAKKLIKDEVYYEKCDSINDSKINELMEEIEKENSFILGEGQKIKSLDSKNKFLLMLIQNNSYKAADEYDIDHFLPKSKFKTLKDLNTNTIFNFQFLSQNKNRNQKKDSFDINHIDWDTFKSKFNVSDKNKYKELLDYLSNYLKENENNKNIDENIIKNKFEDIIKLRKKVMIKELKEYFNSIKN